MVRPSSAEVDEDAMTDAAERLLELDGAITRRRRGRRVDDFEGERGRATDEDDDEEDEDDGRGRRDDLDDSTQRMSRRRLGPTCSRRSTRTYER